MSLSRHFLNDAALVLVAVFVACDVTGLEEGAPGDDQPPTGSVTIAWDAPTTNADGTPLSDLAGYRIHFGEMSPLTPANSAAIDVGNVTTYTITDLEAGTYYFAVRAIDLNGNASNLSNEVSAEVIPQ
ncbi:MAG: fibronectin type III domain-containing protein [Gemmatimonadota bacterium]|nr:MAG: fibronectin type III domain-containing protein [Gemmatimonadota bacterium]